MSEIEYGAKVRAVTEGEYAGRDDHGNHLVRTRAALSVLPSTAEVAVLASPLPPEPPVDAYVEVLPDESSEPEVWKRFPYIHPLHRSLWHDANHPSDPARTWAELHKDGAKVTRLYRADDPEITVREGGQ